MNRRVAQILQTVVAGPGGYCLGAGFAPGDTYVAAPAISIGIGPCLPVACGSAHLNHTIAYDAAEARGANLTQTNMIAVSSFCGINGLVLGHDVLRVPPRRYLGSTGFDGMTVLDLATLEEATVGLLGTVQRPRFPIAPGEHLPCAYKTFSVEGEGVVWGALALAIAADRERNADLFMEELGGERGLSVMGTEAVERILESLLRSVSAVSSNLGVEYEAVYIGLKQEGVPAGSQGCAITAAPYLKLPSEAVPGDDPLELASLSLDEWEKRLDSA